jgi:hypothetical protein
VYDEVVNLPAADIHSSHWVRTATADGQQQYLLTGVLAPHLKASGPDWHQRTLRATIDIGGLAAGQNFVASQWAPSVSLAAVDAEAATTNAGWAIDGFELVGPNLPANQVVLDVHTAVRDSSCYLLRLTYQIVLVGNFA